MCRMPTKLHVTGSTLAPPRLKPEIPNSLRPLIIQKAFDQESHRTSVVTNADFLAPEDLSITQFMLKRLSRHAFKDWFAHGIKVHTPQTLHTSPLSYTEEKRWCESLIYRWIATHTTTNTAQSRRLQNSCELLLRKVGNYSFGYTEVCIRN